MLLDNFFYIISSQQESGQYRAELKIDPAHPIFAGHFPGQPVVPGVCMIEMVRELLENSMKQQIRLKKAAYFKFLAVVDPRIDPTITAVLNHNINAEGNLDVECIFSKKDAVCFKARALFYKENNQL